MLFYGHQLAVLPAVGSDTPDFGDELEAGSSVCGGGGIAAAVANSYVVDLSAQGIREVCLIGRIPRVYLCRPRSRNL